MGVIFSRKNVTYPLQRFHYFGGKKVNLMIYAEVLVFRLKIWD